MLLLHLFYPGFPSWNFFHKDVKQKYGMGTRLCYVTTVQRIAIGIVPSGCSVSPQEWEQKDRPQRHRSIYETLVTANLWYKVLWYMFFKWLQCLHYQWSLQCFHASISL